MPRHNYRPLRGRIEVIEIASNLLGTNCIGEPTRRQVGVYLPPDYGEEPLPLMVDLAGYTGSGLKHLGWQAFGESLPQRIERLRDEGKLGPVVVAFPDCFTVLGGNQYINSRAVGPWADYLVREMVPVLEHRFYLRQGRQHRAVFGKSSGGYGALVHGMRYAAAWGAVACHSGDINFDVCYLRDMPATLDALARFGGSIDEFIVALQSADKVRGGDFHALMILAMAATYDPDPRAPFGIRLPVDPRTCELIPERWEAWLQHDPLRLIDAPATQAGLRSLGALFLDCGRKDQYYLHYGARALRRKLDEYQVPHIYEEFDDNHSGIDYRLDTSLPLLYRAISEGEMPADGRPS